MLALQTKRTCVYCAHNGRPELTGFASNIGGGFWVSLAVSFFIPELFVVTGMLFLWMLFTSQVACHQCGKELLTNEQVRGTYTEDTYAEEDPPHSQKHKDSNNQDKNENRYKQSERNTKKRVFSCPSCKQKIRVSLPIPSGVGRCISCESRFSVYADEEGHLYIETLSENNPPTDNDSITSISDCFSLLGLVENASKLEIKSAYRKKMMEYHPDKVNNLGSKLKSLAEHESKKLNYAVTMLKESGYV